MDISLKFNFSFILKFGFSVKGNLYFETLKKSLDDKKIRSEKNIYDKENKHKLCADAA